ncbi:transposase [Deinococcus oregonensis]|uniref:Transposase n=1 Tax=Deinococcus oregonensis TaxID=1805970 RepID=A0ABV6AVC7_9DEIO
MCGGQAWRLVPHDLLPWETAYFDHRVWRLQGFWEHLQTTLREQVRVQAGRDPTSSTAILDRQTTRTTESNREGHGDTMGARRSTGASGTFWSIRWAWSWAWSCNQSTFKTALERSCYFIRSGIYSRA